MERNTHLEENVSLDEESGIKEISLTELQEVSKLERKLVKSVSGKEDEIEAAEGSDKLNRILSKVYIVIAVIWGTFHLYSTRYFVFAPTRHNDIHLMFAILLLTITFVMENKKRKTSQKTLLFFDLFFFAVMMICCTYIYVEYYNLSLVRQFAKTAMDIVIGGCIIVGVIYFTWRKWGGIIPFFAILSLVYFTYGNKFPVNSIFYFSGAKFTRLIEIMTVNFQGIYGNLLGMSATTIVMFVIFGGVLVSMGALKMVMDIIRILAGENAAGAAQLASIGSAAFGTISGASAANVAVTGSMTIPMMKRRGLDPAFAASVESVASTGGGIMPPVMGATAFLMASLAGVTYWQVVIVATVPAILYYLTISICVQLHCRKLNLAKDANKEKQKGKRILIILKNNLFILIPFGSLLYFMSQNVSATMTALYAILIAFAVRFLHFLFIEKSGFKTACKRMLEDYWKSMKEMAEMMAPIAIIMTALGLFTEAITGTGIGNRLSFSLITMSNNSILPLLILMATVCMFFGCGLPTIPSYILVALIGGPALNILGVPLVLGHYFVLYYANLSQITPPVGISSLVASKIADTSYARTGWSAMKLAIPIYFIPMLLIYYQGLGGMQFVDNAGEYIICILAALYALFPLCVAIEGYFFKKMTIIGRLLLLVPPIVILTKDLIMIGAGFVIMTVVLAVNAIGKLKIQRQANAS